MDGLFDTPNIILLNTFSRDTPPTVFPYVCPECDDPRRRTIQTLLREPFPERLSSHLVNEDDDNDTPKNR